MFDWKKNREIVRLERAYRKEFVSKNVRGWGYMDEVFDSMIGVIVEHEFDDYEITTDEDGTRLIHLYVSFVSMEELDDLAEEADNLGLSIDLTADEGFMIIAFYHDFDLDAEIELGW